MAFTLVICGTASADTYIGGQPLTTVESGMVSGGVYSDSYYGFTGTAAAGSTNDIKKGNVTYNFQPLPSNAEVVSATLYTGVYLGNMLTDYPVDVNITFNGEKLDNQYLSSTYQYVINGGTGLTQVNDHTIRVTSDYFMLYDVTNQVEQYNTVHVNTTNSTFDGRIKLITLIVVYNDGDSDKIAYWINQGQDVSSYLDEEYVGSTTFTGNPPSGTIFENATLKVIHMSSTDGTYNFNGNSLSSSNSQGSYSGSNTWDVTNIYKTTDINTLNYHKGKGSGLGGYYKIAFAILTARYEDKPDLLPLDLNVTSYPYLNYSLVTVNITNNGVNQSGFFDITLYDNGTQVGQQYTYGLRTGQNRTLYFLWKPSAIGNHDLQVMVDKNNTIKESIENNNSLNKQISNQPDLTPTELSITRYSYIHYYYAAVKVTNNGENLTGLFDVTLYDNGTQVGLQKIYGLPAGTTKTIYFFWKPTDNGTHNIQAVIDKNNTIPETNESNNINSKIIN